MFNFGKKSKEEEVEEEKKPVKKRKPRKRAEKKEKEKEEKKPWGKFERYIVLGTLITTISISGILASYSRSWKLPNVPRLAMPDDVFEETFVIEKSKNIDTNKDIVREFELQTKSLSGVYGFEILNLVDNTNYSKFENEVFQAASLIKLPLMTYVYELAEDDRISLESIHTLTEADKIGGSGSLYYEEAGAVRTIRELVEAMGKESDNTAFNILKNKVGEDNLQDYIEEIGMTHTSVSANTTTIADITDFYTKLWEKRLVNTVNRDEILSFLTDTSYESYLPAQLPEEIRVAHKYGREIHVINDAGIIFTDKPFIMVIMTKGVVEKEADQAFSGLAKLLFDYETSR